ncbi:MAG: arsenate reductase family protein [Bulleidia sp.]
MKLICYPKCGTCRKAQKWLDENSISYEYRDISKETPTYEELKLWQEKSGVEIRKMFNTSGRLYKEMNLKDKVKIMDKEEALHLLATDGMLVRRPIAIRDDIVLFGFKEDDYQKLKG